MLERLFTAMLADRQKQQDQLTAAIREFDGQMKMALETVGGSPPQAVMASSVAASSPSASIGSPLCSLFVLMSMWEVPQVRAVCN